MRQGDDMIFAQLLDEIGSARDLSVIRRGAS